MSEQTYDTPETVAEKMANIPSILAIANHYIGENHPGDYFDCERCQPTRRRKVSAERMGINAANWVLPSTEGSKYAHAPNWSVFAGNIPQMRPACSTPLPTWDHRDISVAERAAEGKPPCLKCIRALRHHLKWLGEWVESYENLTWPTGGSE